MAKSKYHLQVQEIPEGFQIFEDRLEVAGVSFRKSDAAAFAASKNGWLKLEREADNKHDKNAIKVIGCSKGFFGTKRRFIGYVPKDASKKVMERGFWGKVKPRLLKTYVGDSGFVEILFQILGPKGQKYQFDPPKSHEGGHYTEYVERVKQLKAENRLDEAIELLLKLVDQTEKEARGHGKAMGVAPWYYEQLAIIYRKDKRYSDEVQILERYENQPKAPGAGPEKLAERLVKARKVKDNQRA
ncbi:hypothetical protein SAMN06295888_1041 [Desulfonatronum zhilinae]|nr:hypothetical protein SAMN06295888_1041 [Desulfonatronum zhilinae]